MAAMRGGKVAIVAHHAWPDPTLESYWYDGYGRRVISTAPTGTIQSIYSQGGQLLYQDNGRTGKQTRYYYLSGSLVDEVDYDVASGVYANRYQHTDALGSPVVVTNGPHSVLERNEYEPYGQVLAGGYADRPGFTGHVKDAQTGMNYMQQRYYDPMIGRFLSTDPVTALSNPVGMFNRYDYAADNPYRFADPDGRMFKDPDSRSRCNNPVFCDAIIPFRQVEPDSCPACTNSGAAGSKPKASPAPTWRNAYGAGSYPTPNPTPKGRNSPQTAYKPPSVLGFIKDRIYLEARLEGALGPGLSGQARGNLAETDQSAALNYVIGEGGFVGEGLALKLWTSGPQQSGLTGNLSGSLRVGVPFYLGADFSVDMKGNFDIFISGGVGCCESALYHPPGVGWQTTEP
jgi:RHS repeat-associated protein